MTADDFIREFELLADAPNSVQKLREMVLQLAVQGKLVPQDPNDEPAAQLLQHVEAERRRLEDEGIIKKSEKLKSVSKDEHPYSLPSEWVWVRLRQITHDCGQKVPDETFTYIDVGSIDKERGLISEDTQVLTPAEAPSRARKLVRPDSVIYSTVRPYLLNIAVIDRDFNPPPIVSTAFFVLQPIAGISSRFIYHYLRSQTFIDYVNDAMTGMAYPAVNDSKMSVGLVPLPPLSEQKRIVAKVDELMRLCDELEERQARKNESRVTLNASCLNALTSSNLCNSVSTCASKLQRSGIRGSSSIIFDNFDILYDTPETVAELRKAILQLAVQGRLVPQDPNDEGVDLTLLSTEKAKLASYAGRSRKAVALNERIHACEFPYTWSIALFDNVADIQGGVTRGRKLDGKRTVDLPYLRVANVQRGYLDLDKIKMIAVPVDEVERYKLRHGDLLITEGGDWDKVGRTAIWANEIEQCLHQNHVFRARVPVSLLSNHWIMMFMNSGVGRSYFANSSKQTTNLASINMTQLRSCPIPLPPLAEQKRIVAKVDELMRLCDELEYQVKTKSTHAEKLMAAAVNTILTPNKSPNRSPTQHTNPTSNTPPNQKVNTRQSRLKNHTPDR